MEEAQEETEDEYLTVQELIEILQDISEPDDLVEIAAIVQDDQYIGYPIQAIQPTTGGRILLVV